MAMKVIKIFFFQCAFLLLFLELGSRVLLKTGRVRDIYNHFSTPEHLAYQGVRWRTEKDVWGSWHKPNFRDRHFSSCFDVVYESNEVGARDSSFSDVSGLKSNIVLLGDSFAEGWGVAKKRSVDSLVEENTGSNVLSFGSAFNFGPVQYYLIYKNLASRYRHDAVVLMFLPSNDFSDNDPESASYSPGRYRPYYYSNDDGSYVIRVPEQAVPRENIAEFSPDSGRFKAGMSMKMFVIQNIYTLRLWNSLRHSIAGPPVGSYGYFSQAPGQVEAATFFVKQTLKSSLANDVAKFLIFVIPEQSEALEYLGNPLKPSWVQSFEELAHEDSRVTFVNGFDFLPDTSDGVRSLYLSCDGHWNGNGHRWAAELISRHLND